MKIGDVVIAIHPFRMFSSTGGYSHAIVASVEPFVMVSEHGDMLWSRESPEKVYPLCQAHPDIVDVALKRAARDGFKVPRTPLRGQHDHPDYDPE